MLQVDEQGIIPEEGAVRIRWEDLTRVAIVTMNAAAGDDVYFVLETRDGQKKLIAHNNPSSEELLGRLQKLPGFDNAVFIEALACCDDAEFPVWSGPPAE